MENERIRKSNICIVIPSYKPNGKLESVINDYKNLVGHIIVIDDKCPQNSGKFILKRFKNDKSITVLFNKKNLGVGGAVINGMKYALSLNYKFIVKVDADGQMSNKYLPEFIDKLHKSDYVKGNRFSSLQSISSMPNLRLFGNFFLTILSKFSTGFYGVNDPTNGYIGINSDFLRKINLDTVDKRFFFETDLLFHLYLSGATVSQVNMIAFYGDEVSNLSPMKSIPVFLYKNLKNFFKRIFYTYFIENIGLGTIFLIFIFIFLIFYIFYDSSILLILNNISILLFMVYENIISSKRHIE